MFSKAQVAPSSFFSKCLAPTSKVNGRYGVTSRYGTGGRWLVGVVFVSLQLSKMNSPTQIGWLIQRFLELYYIQMIQFFCCCVVMFKFPCQFLRKKRGTFLVAKKTTSEGSKKKMTHGEVSCGLCNHSFYVAEHLSHFLLVTLNLIQSRDTLPPTIMDFRRKMGVSPWWVFFDLGQFSTETIPKWRFFLSWKLGIPKPDTLTGS